MQKTGNGSDEEEEEEGSDDDSDDDWDNIRSVVIFLYLCLIGCSLRFKCNEDRFLLTLTRFVICLSKHHHH
jgi:hypothetical protein